MNMRSVTPLTDSRRPPQVSSRLTPTLSEQKILTMTPTEEEKQKIQEAQLANPDVPLGTAEQFLFSLASISALIPRLQLWAFKLNYEALEKVTQTHTVTGGESC